MRKPLIMLTALATAGLLSAPALAEREPTQQERTRIEQSLKKQGYVNWESIEFEDGQWKVENAETADGKVYDLGLEENTFKILETEPDERSMRERQRTEPEQRP